MADDTRLNSLDRFRKQPGRLVLEEHSHCEVPAGCGGVVLRWRNPHAALPVTVYLYAPVNPVCFLDSDELQTGRLDLVSGRHIAAVFLEDVELSAGLLMLAAIHDSKDYQRILPAEIHEPPLKMLSTDDGTWKFSPRRPPDEWTALAFDDRDWPALVKTDTPRLTSKDFGANQCHRCAGHGAICLRLPQPPAGKPRATWWRKLLVAVPWQAALELAARLSSGPVRYGLPTEAQWEKAARGGLIGARHAWGDEPPTHDRCDFGRFNEFSILPSWRFPPNGYGLSAMNGGVWEWTRDWYDRDAYRQSAEKDPEGPGKGEEKVLRGGSWADCAEVQTVTFRMSRKSKSWTDKGWGGHEAPNLGFRLCRTVAAER